MSTDSIPSLPCTPRQVYQALLESLTRAGVAVTREQVDSVLPLAPAEAIRHLLVCGSESRVAQVHTDFMECLSGYTSQY